MIKEFYIKNKVSQFWGKKKERQLEKERVCARVGNLVHQEMVASFTKLERHLTSYTQAVLKEELK